MVRPHAITDHTTLFQRRSWAARLEGRSNADPLVEIDSMTTTEKRLITAFKKALNDHKTHKLSALMLQDDLKSLTAELKLPHTKVRHILKNVPKEIMYFEDPKSGHTLLALQQASTNRASSSQAPRASTSRQDSRDPSTSIRNNGAQASDPLFRAASPVERGANSSEDDSITSDSDSDRSARRAARKNDSARRHSDSTWGMQRPHVRQQQTKEIASASISPQKKDKTVRPGPRRSAPVASTSALGPQTTDLASQAINGNVANGSDDEEDLLRAIRQSMSAAPPSGSQQQAQLPTAIPLRKQPASPSMAAIREVAAVHGLELEEDKHVFQQPNPVQVIGGMPTNGDADATATPSQFQGGQEEYGVEIPFDQVQNRAGPSRLQDGDGFDGIDFDLDMDTTNRSSNPVKSHHRTTSGGGSARKEMPDQFFDGYKATRARGRSVRPGPPGMDEASTRDSSVQDADSIEDHDLEDDKPENGKPIIQKRGPTKPGRRHVNDGSSSDDVIVVTSVRVGAPAAKSREERETEREERRKYRKEKEARRLDKEKSRKRREKNPLPTFRHTQGQEAAELKLAYQAYLLDLRTARSKTGSTSMHNIIDLDADEAVDALPDLLTETEKNASWTQVFSNESLKGRGNRPDYNTVKFWPYDLPFPGRAKNEAIVAVAGGGVVRVFRLSEKRGVTELWNAVDESVNWEQETWREAFYTCAWTHDVRTDSNIAPHWRKWPILCVAGRSKEVKILDGYSGATLKVIQGHGGSIYSLAVHPSLPHVIATASGDEAISLWDISVPVSKLEVEAGHGNLDEVDKRRKGYVEGERLCLFGGYAGHVEAVLSIAIHPSLPLLVSGGGDCKLRIWRLPDNLPSHPTSSLTHPIPIDPPEKSVKPASYAFPIFTQASIHSHHIDHVEWIGHHGHILTRSLCFNAPGKRVVRLFRPKFFDVLEKSLSKPVDVVGFGLDFPSQVEMLARWTAPSCSGGIGDGVMCTATELIRDQDGKMSTRRRVYVPSIEPALHIYDIDLKNKQSDLEALVHEYTFKLGQEILLAEDKRKNSALKAADCQPSGRGWLVAVGEGEKILVWSRKVDSAWRHAQVGLHQLLRDLKLSDKAAPQSIIDMDTEAASPPPPMHADAFVPRANGRENGNLYNGMNEDDRNTATNGAQSSREEAPDADSMADDLSPHNGHMLEGNAVNGSVESPLTRSALDISATLRHGSESEESRLPPTLRNGFRDGITQVNGSVIEDALHQETHQGDAEMYIRSPSVEYVAY